MHGSTWWCNVLSRWNPGFHWVLFLLTAWLNSQFWSKTLFSNSRHVQLFRKTKIRHWHKIVSVLVSVCGTEYKKILTIECFGWICGEFILFWPSAVHKHIVQRCTHEIIQMHAHVPPIWQNIKTERVLILQIMRVVDACKMGNKAGNKNPIDCQKNGSKSVTGAVPFTKVIICTI